MNAFVEKLVEEYAKSREKYCFFDVNCWWDYTDEKTFHNIDSFDQLKEELNSYSIKKAVVTSVECLKHDPLKANDKLSKLIENKKDVYGCMVLVPELSMSDKMICDYVDEKIQQGFVCARMFPKKLRHSMKKWCVGKILDYLEERRLPLILWHNEVSWDLIEDLCREYKNLPIIVEGNDTKLLYHNRNYVILLKEYGNLYLETHNIILFSEIDFLVNGVGSDKLIFGTYFPYNTPNAAMMPITKGNFSEEDKCAIASQNLEQLIKEIR